MAKHSAIRRTKRRFQGNQYTECKKRKTEESTDVGKERQQAATSSTTTNPVQSTTHKSVSFKKIGPTNTVEDQTFNQPSITGYRLVDMELLANVFSSLGCAECGHFTLAFMENHLARKGCSSSLKLLCENCGWKQEFCSSKKQGKSFEVNRRLVYSMRSLGKGHSGAKKFCTLMNMPPPPVKCAYRKASRSIAKKIKGIAKKSMAEAATEIRNAQGASGDEVVNCGVSCDGTWQRRGFSSLNGCIAVLSIESGKVLDAEALTKVCKQCQLHFHMDKESEEYRSWKADHVNCKANFDGSAPAMEAEGAQRIFERSIENNQLRYTELYGDGDSKSHQQVKDIIQQMYLKFKKKQCIGHVQKRVGTALRKLKKEDSKLGGKGKLTNHMIDKLQNYYGIAIRSNVGNLEGMKKAVAASLFHCASSDKRPLHEHCPPGDSSWCAYQQGKAKGVPNEHKHGPGLPLEVIAKVKPIYQRLSQDDLLQKCLHGKTQNQNESLNGMIWQRVPKEVFVGRELLEFGMCDAISHFNMGAKTILKLLEELNISSGKYTQQGCDVLDKERIYVAEYKEKDSSKKRRKVLRGKKKKKEDKKQKAEGKTYAAGAF